MVQLPIPHIEMRPTPLQGMGAGGSRHLLDKQSLVPVAQELWNAWEIHFLILISLFLQVFLFLFAGMRRRSSSRFLQTVLWLAYLSADSVAVFVLGHLAVLPREPGHQLVFFWAPFVLLHLGGQETITAFAKQDNDLWMRHLLTLVFQVGVAGYVVAKASWQDARLRAAMVIMFLCGCFKYFERTVSLFFANIGNLRNFSESVLPQNLKGWKPTSRKAKRVMKGTLDEMLKGSSSGPPSKLFWESNNIVLEIISVDAPINQSQNITVAAHGDLPGLLKEFLSSESRYNAYLYVGALLDYCYRRLYTKDPLRLVFIQSWHGIPCRIVQKFLRTFYLPCLLFTLLSTTIATSIALALFMAVDKEDQLRSGSRVDIAVTYALLVGAIILDVSSAAIFIFPHLSFYLPCLAKRIPSVVAACCTERWSPEIRQYNMINGTAISESRWFRCDVKCKPKEDASFLEFTLDTLLASGTRKEWNIASTRGQLALHKWMDHHQNDEHYSADHLNTTSTMKSLEETIKSTADFPTSILILHIATDICYHFEGTNSDHQVKKHKQTSTQLSNYIMYLVFTCGVMLTTNSKVVLNSADTEIDEVLSQPPKVDPRNKDARVMKLFETIKKQQEEGSMREIQIRLGESEDDSTIEIENEESTDIDDNADDDHMKKLKRSSQTLTSPVLPRAVAVAQELISINDEAERWKLIAEVWAEMLYYIAPRCGGAFHYEHLSTGGEFVSHVLLLMYYLGPFLPPPPDA